MLQNATAINHSNVGSHQSRARVTRAIGILFIAFAYAAASLGQVNAEEPKLPNLPNSTPTDKKTMDGNENRGNNVGRNENTKPTAPKKAKAAKSKSAKPKPKSVDPK